MIPRGCRLSSDSGNRPFSSFGSFRHLLPLALPLRFGVRENIVHSAGKGKRKRVVPGHNDMVEQRHIHAAKRIGREPRCLQILLRRQAIPAGVIMSQHGTGRVITGGEAHKLAKIDFRRAHAALVNDAAEQLSLIHILRHSATSALSERRDVIIVASVSCIYSLGDPIDYRTMVTVSYTHLGKANHSGLADADSGAQL